MFYKLGFTSEQSFIGTKTNQIIWKKKSPNDFVLLHLLIYATESMK